MENSYDTRLLHRNIAFPLLKKLTEVGDPQARKVFKEEIAQRLTSGFESVVLYLLTEGYVQYLSLEELESLSLDLNIKKTEMIERSIIKVLKTSGTEHDLKEHLFKFLSLLNKDIVGKMEFVEYNGEKFFVNDGVLNIHLTKDERKKIEKITDIKGLNTLSELKELHINNQKIKKIHGLNRLKNLEILWLRGNEITGIEGLEKLVNLKELALNVNSIQEIKGLDNNKKLTYLNLSDNDIEEIKGLENLINLKGLYLLSNKIKEIKGLDNNLKLENLNLLHNHIRKVCGISHLKNLKHLSLDNDVKK